MTETSYLMGTGVLHWRERDVKNVTFVVTEDCNLICKYCYITGKNSRNKMSWETAKKAVDYLLSHPEEFPEDNVIFDFMGGEPLLEIELIDQISDYIKTEMYRLNHKWFENYRFNMASNGLLYGTPAVQRYIEKNRNNLSIGISIDGNKLKHDQQRIKPDGSGSYDEILKNIPLWLSQFPGASTKATFSSDDLIYLKDSVIALYELGIKDIPANVIFEDVWKEGDDLIFEDQLRQLADYIIDNRLWNDFNTTLFYDAFGFPLSDEEKKQNWCGAGKMLAIDHEGKFYPCVRFVGYSLNQREGYVIGDLDHGYDQDKLRPFLALTLEKQSPGECLNCQVAQGCAWCQGFNYDSARIDTIYERATYICKMHKARVRANDYYWARLREVGGVERQNTSMRKDFLYFQLSGRSARHCTYQPNPETPDMPLEVLKQGLEFAQWNFYTPILLLPPEGLTDEQQEALHGYDVTQFHTGKCTETTPKNIRIFDNQVEKCEDEICILLLKQENIAKLSDMVEKIYLKQRRINLVLEDIEQFTDAQLAIYEQQLEKIAEFLEKEHLVGNRLDFNVLTDLAQLPKMANCNAGVDSFTLGPDGKLYICPAFYFDGHPAVGSLEEGINFNYQEFLTLDKSPLCSECDALHCRRCVFLNRKQTREYLIPGQTQCVVSHIEKRMSQKLNEKLAEIQRVYGRPEPPTPTTPDYLDPLEKILFIKWGTKTTG